MWPLLVTPDANAAGLPCACGQQSLCSREQPAASSWGQEADQHACPLGHGIRSSRGLAGDMELPQVGQKPSLRPGCMPSGPVQSPSFLQVAIHLGAGGCHEEGAKQLLTGHPLDAGHEAHGQRESCRAGRNSPDACWRVASSAWEQTVSPCAEVWLETTQLSWREESHSSLTKACPWPRLDCTSQ